MTECWLVKSDLSIHRCQKHFQDLTHDALKMLLCFKEDERDVS